jgi:AraC family transcriptional activator of pobA
MPRRAQIPRYFLYGEAPRQVATPFVHVETIEARSTRHHWHIDPHAHQALHQVIFVVRGCGITQLDGMRAQIRPPALVLIPAGTVHSFEFEPGTRGHVISMSDQLHRELVLRDPTTAALFTRAQILELRGNQVRDTDVALAIRMLAREFPGTDTGHDIAMRGWLHVLAGNALRLIMEQPESADPAVGQRRVLLERFFGVVEQRFRTNQSVDSYAAALHVSTSRLRRACHALTGRSPMQLVHSRLLLEAKRELHYTDNQVSKISIGLGFDDAAYFTRFFTSRVGISPRAFRKRGPESAQSIDGGAV